jgi:hypothetical protein
LNLIIPAGGGISLVFGSHKLLELFAVLAIGAQNMDAAAPTCDAMARLSGMLQDLSHILQHHLSANVSQQLMLEEAARAVSTLMDSLLDTQLQQLSQLVRTKQWDEATRQMHQNFQDDNTIGHVVKAVLQLTYDGLEELVSAVHWVGHLDVHFQPSACRALYELMQLKGHAHQPHVLLLWRRVGGDEEPSTSHQCDEDCCRMVERIASGIKKCDFSDVDLICKIDDEHDEIDKDGFVLNKIMSAVVSKFDVCKLEDTLPLIKFFEKMPRFTNCWCLIDALLKRLEAKRFLHSAPGFHVWALARWTSAENNWQQLDCHTQNLCTNAMMKLDLFDDKYFKLYEQCLEDDNKQKIRNLHNQNSYLYSIMSEFISWYFQKNDMSRRVQNLLLASRSIGSVKAVGLILTGMFKEMLRLQQLDTFEAFQVHNESLNICFALKQPDKKAPFERLNAQVPNCLRLVFACEGNQLRLVNKSCDLALCVEEKKVLCCPPQHDEKQHFGASVHVYSALTSFSITLNGSVCWNLEASGDTVRVSLTRSWWKVKTHDGRHVKIFNHQGTKRNDEIINIFCFMNFQSSFLQLRNKM